MKDCTIKTYKNHSTTLKTWEKENLIVDKKNFVFFSLFFHILLPPHSGSKKNFFVNETSVAQGTEKKLFRASVYHVHSGWKWNYSEKKVVYYAFVASSWAWLLRSKINVLTALKSPLELLFEFPAQICNVNLSEHINSHVRLFTFIKSSSNSLSDDANIWNLKIS